MQATEPEMPDLQPCWLRRDTFSRRSRTYSTFDDRLLRHLLLTNSAVYLPFRDTNRLDGPCWTHEETLRLAETIVDDRLYRCRTKPGLLQE